jgi:hypothetical protein
MYAMHNVTVDDNDPSITYPASLLAAGLSVFDVLDAGGQQTRATTAQNPCVPS